MSRIINNTAASNAASNAAAIAAAATLERRFAAAVAAKHGKEAAWEALVASQARLECPEEALRAWEHVEEAAGQGDIPRAKDGLEGLRSAGIEIQPLVGWVEACEGFEEARLPRVGQGGGIAAMEEAIVAALREKGEVIVEYSPHYGVEVYLHVSGLVLEANPDVEDGAFLAPTEAVKAWGERLIEQAEARFEEEKAHIDAYLCGLNDRLAIAIAQVDIDVARCGQTLGGTWFELCVAQKDVEGALEALKAMMPVDSDDIPSVGRARKLLEEAAKVGPNGASARIDAAVKTAAEVGGRPYILYSDAMEARRCLGCGGNVGRLTVAENKEYVADGLCLSCRREATVDNGCMVCGRRVGPGTYCGCQD